MSSDNDFKAVHRLLDDTIKGAKDQLSIVVMSHVNPDPDAIGSSCGLAEGLRRYISSSVSKLDITNFNSGASDTDLNFIPFLENVKEPNQINFSQIKSAPNLIIVCDCGDLDRVGSDLVSWINTQKCPLISLDHHASNSMFGDVNLVDTKLSSTSELVYLLLEHLKVSMNQEIASCLLAGILGDTGGFRYRSATADTLARAAELVKAGANLSSLAEKLFGSVPLSTVRLESFALQNIRMSSCGKVAGVLITEDDYKEIQVDSNDGEGLAEKLRDIKGVIASYSIRWMEGKWKVSLRTSSSDVDLTTIAIRYGGGGHRAAAAFRFSKDAKLVAEDLDKSLLALVKDIKC